MIGPMEQWPAEIEPFTEWLKARRPHHVIELGVRHGGTSANWHTLASGLVIGVDWTGEHGLGKDTAAHGAEMEAALPRFRMVIGDSHDAQIRDRVATLLGSCADFLFIDADHSYEGVCRDWDLWTPLVAPGGCVAFHDIVDSPLIRRVGHGVYRFWAELRAKGYWPMREFCLNEENGGIGVVEL